MAAKKARQKFTTLQASVDLMEAMEDAIRHMTKEVAKVPDETLSGSQRRSELQSYKETALSCKELIMERQKLVQLVKELHETDDGEGVAKEAQDFSSGYAEKYAKK